MLLLYKTSPNVIIPLHHRGDNCLFLLRHINRLTLVLTSLFLLPTPLHQQTPLTKMTLPIRRSLTLTPTLTRLLPHRHPHRHPHIRTRRAYSDQKPHEAKQTSDLPWYTSLPPSLTSPSDTNKNNRMIGALGLGGSAAWYLVHTGPEKKPHKGHDHHDGKTIHHETNTEQEEEDQQSEPAASAAAKEPEQSIARETQVAEARSQNPAVVDKVLFISFPSFLPAFPLAVFRAGNGYMQIKVAMSDIHIYRPKLSNGQVVLRPRLGSSLGLIMRILRVRSRLGPG